MSFTPLVPSSPPPWLPSDNGLLAASADPWLCASSSVITGGELYLSRLPWRSAGLITNLWFILATSGVGASTGSFAALFSAAGVQLSETVDIGAALVAATGPFSVPLLAPQEVQGAGGPSGWPLVGVLANLATTEPGLARSASQAAAPNLNLTPANARFAVNGTGLSVMPASIVPAANAGTGGANLWVGAN
jgi:hypothetical protein